MIIDLKRISLLFCVTLLVASCGQKPVFDEFKSISGTWHADSVLNFSFQVEDVAPTYAVNVKLRHDASYAFSNIYMFRTITSSSGIEYQDTVNFTLADKRGKWLGKGVGELKTMVWPYRANAIKFNTPGKYTFTLQQGMRSEALKGVSDVGLEVFVIENEE